VVLLLALVGAALTAGAQPLGFTIDTETPEGKLLQEIGTESEPAKKIVLLEQFAEKHAAHEGIAWVYGQMPAIYAGLGKPTEALAICDKLYEKQPANSQAAHGCLKIAEAQKDAGEIRQWAANTHAAARKFIEAPKPQDADEEEYKQNLDFSQQVGAYAEYSLYAGVLQIPDPAQKVLLYEALKELNPKSQYLPQIVPHAFAAYRQANAPEKAAAMAEEAAAQGQANEDMLLVLADYYFNQAKDPVKTLDACGKLIAYLEPKGPPEGVAAADWEKKKTVSIGMAHFLAGMTHANQKKHAETDKELRLALAGIRDNPQLAAPALFYLGVANYELGKRGKGDTKRILEAFNFTRDCAAIPGPFQASAKKNLAGIQAEYRIK
jgi:hypothetical protein